MSLVGSHGSSVSNPVMLKMSDMTDVEYKGLVQHVTVRDVGSYFMLKTAIVKAFKLGSDFGRHLILRDSDGKDIPDIQPFTVSRSFAERPIQAELCDTIPVQHKERVYRVDVSKCWTYADLANKVISTVRTRSSCLEQVSMYLNSRDEKKEKAIDLTVNLPLAHERKYMEPVIFREMKKIILLEKLDYLGDRTGKFTKRLFESDSQIKELRGGLVPVDEDGNIMPDGSTVSHIHDIDESYRYTVTRVPFESFERWQQFESEIREDDLGRSIKELIKSSNGDPVTLPRKLFPKQDGVNGRSSGPTQEWDAAVYDKDSQTLYMGEHKHNGSTEHVEEVFKKCKRLPFLLNIDQNREYAELDVSKIAVIFASDRMTSGLAKSCSKKGINLFGRKGDLYGLHSSRDLIGDCGMASVDKLTFFDFEEKRDS
jgi:hypothetical protein